MIINRVWAMPNKWTFKIKPIKKLLEKYKVGKGWIDPFAGMYSPAEIRNDHLDKCNSEYHMDAVDFVRQLDNHYKGCLFDPPYSIHEVKRHYDSIGMKYDFKNDPTCGFKKVRDILSTKVNMCISFGWNSVGLGKNRGFEIIEILLVSHGGNRNDTICTVERKIQKRLEG